MFAPWYQILLRAHFHSCLLLLCLLGSFILWQTSHCGSQPSPALGTPFLDCILSMGNLSHALYYHPYPDDPTQPPSFPLVFAIKLAPLPAPALPHLLVLPYAPRKGTVVCSEPDQTPTKLGVLSNFSLSLPPSISKPSHLFQFNSQIAL